MFDFLKKKNSLVQTPKPPEKMPRRYLKQI